MIGIKFHIPNNWNNYLFQILKGIDSSDFIWQIGEEEVLGNRGEVFLKKSFMIIKAFFIKFKNDIIQFLLILSYTRIMVTEILIFQIIQNFCKAIVY